MSSKTPRIPFLAFSLLATLTFSAPAQAGVEDKYLDALKASGYKCTNTPKSDGYFCTKGSTYITIPKGLASHTHNLFYAHGLVGVCGNGASGEAFLNNDSPTLRRVGAIGIMPYRPSAASTGFPLARYLAQVEKDMGSEQVPLIMAGHSAGGTFLGAELAANPSVASRVDRALLLDAIYNEGRSASLWSEAVEHHPGMAIQVISSTTAAKARGWVSTVKSHDPNVSLEIKGDAHCNMPRYFGELQ